MLPALDMHHVPVASRATFHSWLLEFRQADRGSIRGGNDQTFESRARHFANWLQRFGYNYESIEAIPEGQTLALVGLFLRCVAQGDTILASRSSSSRPPAPLGAKTLASYAAAAGAWLEFHFGKKAQLYLPSSLSGKHRLHPFLAETIAQRRNWQVPRKKKEPFTSPMFLVLHHDVSSLARDPSRLLDLLPAIYDWTRLGIFTGSRLGEYGQSKLRSGELFATVPMCPDAGEWAGTPLAFIREDFEFFDEQRHSLLRSDLPRLQRYAAEVHIRFRYDKSTTNFAIRKFRRLRSTFICPVSSCVSILERAAHLRIPDGFPIGAYRSSTAGDFKFIRGDDVCRVMRYACTIAYPDIRHYMRQNVDRLVAHSNRVTACLALHQAGVNEEEIAHRLRWQTPSVRFYIPESYSKLGDLTQRAVAGAALTT
jgi:hypothetical protein